jgi:hypothetical protein
VQTQHSANACCLYNLLCALEAELSSEFQYNPEAKGVNNHTPPHQRTRIQSDETAEKPCETRYKYGKMECDECLFHPVKDISPEGRMRLIL